MADAADNIEAIREKLGPKRVKTPLIEVEQFDLDQLDRIAQKSNTFKPMFSNFLFSTVVPKDGLSCVSCSDGYDNSGTVPTTAPAIMKTLNGESLYGMGNIVLGNDIAVTGSLSGTINGSNTTFTTTENFDTDQIQVFLNGVLQRQTTDYTISGSNTIIFVTAPQLGDNLSILYKKS